MLGREAIGGAPEVAGATIAVKLSDWPKTEGLPEEISVVVVFCLFTVWVKAVDVLPAKLELPA